MLWFDDNSQREISEKIKRAADHYQSKYGACPDTCFVHPLTLLGIKSTIPGIAVKPSNSMLPNHFWIGCEGGTEVQQQRPAA
jgi:hypothetical protein